MLHPHRVESSECSRLTNEKCDQALLFQDFEDVMFGFTHLIEEKR